MEGADVPMDDPTWELAFAALPVDALQCPWCAAINDAADAPCERCGLQMQVELD